MSHASPAFLEDLGHRLGRLKDLTASHGVLFPPELEDTFKTLLSRTHTSSKGSEELPAAPSAAPEVSELDLSFSSEDSRLDKSALLNQVTEMKLKTSKIGTLVTSQFEEFKKANSRSFRRDEHTKQELQSVYEELTQMKRSMSLLVLDTHHTKAQIRELQEIAGSFSRLGSPLKLTDQSLGDSLDGLRRQMQTVVKRVQDSVQEIQQHDSENKRLRDTIKDLRISLESEDRTTSCTRCNVF